MAQATISEALAWLASELAESGITFEQAPHAGVAGFTLVARRGSSRAEFAWNPGDDTLSVSYADAEGPLVHDAFISVPNGEGLYAEIASEATQMLAV